MFLMTVLCLLCFVAGIAVRHAYRDDEPLLQFADAVLTVAKAPVLLAKAAQVSARAQLAEKKKAAAREVPAKP